MATHNFEHLRRAIVAMSEAHTWDDAVGEWELVHVDHRSAHTDPPETCLCTHHPIYEVCHIRNVRNGRTAIVGNVCIRRFLEHDIDRIAAGLSRIKADIEAAMNPPAIAFAYRRGYINDWERKFYLNTWNRRGRLTPDRLAKRVQVNRKVLRLMGRDRPPTAPLPHTIDDYSARCRGSAT